MKKNILYIIFIVLLTVALLIAAYLIGNHQNSAEETPNTYIVKQDGNTFTIFHNGEHYEPPFFPIIVYYDGDETTYDELRNTIYLPM